MKGLGMARGCFWQTARILIASLPILFSSCAGSEGPDPRARVSAAEQKKVARSVEEMAAFQATCFKRSGDVEPLNTISERAYKSLMTDTTIGLGETGLMSLRVDSEGRFEGMTVKKASSKEFGAAMLRALEAAKPYPVLEGMDRVCFAGGPMMLALLGPSAAKCALRDDFTTYREDVSREVYSELYMPALLEQPGTGYVGFDLIIGSQGKLESVSIRSSPNEAVTAKLKLAVGRAAPYPAPPMFEECFSGKPLKMQLEVVDSESM